MQQLYFYPAIFHKAEPDEDFQGFWVEFPDIPEALTQGEDMKDAYKMAYDCLGLSLTIRQDENMEIPLPSSFDSIQIDSNSTIVLIEIDLTKYKKKVKSKSIKKTLTIPEWLDDEAKKEGINFSQLLQEALISKLGI